MKLLNTFFVLFFLVTPAWARGPHPHFKATPEQVREAYRAFIHIYHGEVEKMSDEQRAYLMFDLMDLTDRLKGQKLEREENQALGYH